jgi:hypothetical protein
LLIEFFFVWGALPDSAGCFKKVTETPNAGHRLCGIKNHIWWLKYGPLGNFFLSVGSQKKQLYNFNTATHGGLKNKIKLTGRVPQPPASNGSKKHLLGHISSFWCYNFEIVGVQSRSLWNVRT